MVCVLAILSMLIIIFNAMRYHAMLCYAMLFDAMRCDAMRCYAKLRDGFRHGCFWFCARLLLASSCFGFVCSSSSPHPYHPSSSNGLLRRGGGGEKGTSRGKMRRNDLKRCCIHAYWPKHKTQQETNPTADCSGSNSGTSIR